MSGGLPRRPLWMSKRTYWELVRLKQDASPVFGALIGILRESGDFNPARQVMGGRRLK